MSVIYNVGETKKRPGIYRRHSNIGLTSLAGGQDGICAIPVKAEWGPLGVVVRNTQSSNLTDTYGTGAYDSTKYTVPAAEAMFKGGASTVYTYRLGTGGKAGELKLGDDITITAKYPGAMAISVAVQKKLGDDKTKQFLVYTGSTLVEKFEFAADTQNEGENLKAAVASSAYIIATGSATTVAELAVASGALAGGENPSVTNVDYSKAFAALESYYYNTIALDIDDDENMTYSKLLKIYFDGAYKLGKLGIAVVGQKSTVAFATRCANAKSFNDEKVVFLGGGYKAGTENKDGVLSICYTAGVIAATPSNQGITHTTIGEATELCESLTFAQYEEAIDAGMLVLSVASDGSIWYDSGINTLTKLDETQDEGWKKIRRVKVRHEMIDRLDRALAPKVGKVSADSDGIADIVQTAQRVLDSMSNNEGKLQPGASFVEDPSNPYSGDSAWFLIQADDIDSLEKIYMHYQFRYSQNV